MGIRNESQAAPPEITPKHLRICSSGARTSSSQRVRNPSAPYPSPHARSHLALENFGSKVLVALACFFQQNCEGRVLTEVIQQGIGG